MIILKCKKCAGVWGTVGTILWLLAAIALVLGWVATNQILGIWGMDSTGWLLTALVLAVLATPCLTLGKCSCGACPNCGGRGCANCK